MKRSSKLILGAAALLGAAVLVSGCTANFCRDDEKCRMMFAIEPGVSRYYGTEEAANDAKKTAEEGYTYTIEMINPNLWRSVEKKSGDFTKSSQLASINKDAVGRGITVPSDKYFIGLDQEILLKACQLSGKDILYVTAVEVNGFETVEPETEAPNFHPGILAEYGYNKFSATNTDLWSSYDSTLSKMKADPAFGLEVCPTRDYVSLYKSSMEAVINNNRSCIATTSGYYGNFGDEKTMIYMEGKDWGYAWSRGGAVIEGLIVYPVSWMVDQFARTFAGGSGATEAQIAQAYSTGVPQILALTVVTVIVRLFIFLCSFKSTLDQQKMQRIQPELTKIQAKYPNSNTNQAEKQRLAEEQMKLYKKHKINPLSQLLVLVIQFPVFIGVWGAMTGSAVLATGSFLNLDLSKSIWTALTNTNGLPSNMNGWWTALVLFIIMAVSQFFSMKVPQWIQKSRAKKVARLTKNPAQNSQNRTMTIFSYVMLVMIIVMGFTLPAAMGFYWFVGALFSLIQTLITQLIMNRKRK